MNIFTHFIIAILTGFLLIPGNTARSQTGIPIPEMSHCDNLVSTFMNTYQIPSATFAMAKDGRLVYARGFGYADLAQTELTQPHHLFRIASISKPITSISIMKLVENGHISLTDKVFGTGGILENHPYLSLVQPTDQRIYEITVNHLLEHTAGWNRDVDCTPSPTSPYPWHAGHCDPIGFPLHVTQTLGESNPVTGPILIRFLMEKGLNFAPGTQYAYSNIGYLILGEVIAAVSGKSYEQYVQEDILQPAGICDMHIGGNLLEEKLEREGEYAGNGFTTPSLYGNGQSVPWEYGGFSVHAMDAHGGWVATARDLVRLLTVVDGFQTKADILSSATISTMTSPSTHNQFYAKGWSVNSANHWWHTGSLDGTASIWVRSNGGYTWAIILNKRVIGPQSNQFWTDLDNLPWSCLNQTSSWPTHDFLSIPSQNANFFSQVPSGNDAVSITLLPGNGQGHVLVGREGQPVNQFPLDGTTYNGHTAFGQGDDLGEGNFVLSAGADLQPTITGLDPMKTYHWRVFEYSQSTSTGNHILYKLCEPTQDSIQLSSVGIDMSFSESGISISPNPTHGQFELTIPPTLSTPSIAVKDLTGKIVYQQLVLTGTQIVSLPTLPAQVYLLLVKDGESVLGRERMILME